MNTLYQIDPSALAALDEAAQSKRLSQGSWGDGDTVCALSAMFKREDGSPSAPEWLLAVIRALFDGKADSVDHALARIRPIIEWLSEAPRAIPETAKYAWLGETVLPEALSQVPEDDPVRKCISDVINLCQRAASGDMPNNVEWVQAAEEAAWAAAWAAWAAAKAAKAAEAAEAWAATAATAAAKAWAEAHDRLASGLLASLKSHELKAKG